ncbi:4Fe-4S binding protein [Pseudomonas sp. KCJK9111]|uniref:4Fe-4S binding protein n=1 Tax=Pseudomonas sp. KCJK9111 TaxID=3344555 RepID=UPI0039068228
MRGTTMAYEIFEDCIVCGACKTECPTFAISSVDDKYVIDAQKCTECGACASVCPVDAARDEKSD